MKKTVLLKILVIAIIITTFATFLATMPVYAAGNVGEFYYKGTTGATYSVGKSGLSKIIDALAGLADLILGIMTMGIRIVFVGWAALFEWILVVTIDAVCKTNLQENDNDIFFITPLTSIMNTENRVTIEKIVFNEIPIFDVNIFDFSTGEEEEEASN